MGWEKYALRKLANQKVHFITAASMRRALTQPSKAELREILAQAAANTAASEKTPRSVGKDA